MLLLLEERVCEVGLPQVAEGLGTGGRAASGYCNHSSCGTVNENTIMPQLGALPRVGQSRSMSFFLATRLKENDWYRTHCKGHVERPDAGSTTPWLLNSLFGRQRSVIDNCARASVFSKGNDDNADSHDVQPLQLTATGDARSKRQLALFQPHCMTAAACQSDTTKFPIVSVSEATQQVIWFVFGLGTQLMVPHQDAERVERALQDAQSVDLVWNKACAG